MPKHEHILIDKTNSMIWLFFIDIFFLLMFDSSDYQISIGDSIIREVEKKTNKKNRMKIPL